MKEFDKDIYQKTQSKKSNRAYQIVILTKKGEYTLIFKLHYKDKIV